MRKSAQNAPPHPPDPPKRIFLLGGMCSKWPMPKDARTLHYMSNLRCTVPIFSKKRQKCAKKRPPGAPPPPLTPWNAFFCWGGMCSKWPMPKNAISLFYGVNLRCFVPIFSKKLENVQKNAPRGRGGKSGKSCHPRWQKIYPKSRFGRKYFQNIEKAYGSSSIIQQKCRKSGQFSHFWSNKFQIKHKK